MPTWSRVCRPLAEVGRIRIQNGCRTAVTGKFVVFDPAGVAGLVDAGRLLVGPGDEEARPSGPVLRDLRHLAGEVAAV